MRLLRSTGLSLLLSITACGVVEPIHARTRCRRLPDGGVAAVYRCQDPGFALCNVAVEPVNGEYPGVCCDVGENRDVCAQSAGFTANDGGVINQ